MTGSGEREEETMEKSNVDIPGPVAICATVQLIFLAPGV